MTRFDEEAGPIQGEEPAVEAVQGVPAEPKTAPEAAVCPVCERIIPAPAPDICPHCQAPIHSINALLDMAEMSLDEAMRDLRTGDIRKAEARLEFVRVTSKRHRLKAEIVQAIIDRLKGDPTSAVKRLNSVREKIGDEERDLEPFLAQVEKRTLEDQDALALCCEHHNFALFQAQRGHFEEARRSLEAALREAPYHAPSHALMGKVLLALREEDEARYHLRRALASDPSNPTATSLLARLSGWTLPNPFIWLRAKMTANPSWTGSVVVIVILAVIALAALLTR